MTFFFVVYLQQIKKKAKSEGKTCHPKTMLSLEKAIGILNIRYSMVSTTLS